MSPDSIAVQRPARSSAETPNRAGRDAAPAQPGHLILHQRDQR
jgi:hypothetical protein